MERVKIVSTGYYLPSRILTNKELEKMVDTTSEWITTRTGIKERRIARDNEAASDMGSNAAAVAMAKAGVAPEDVDVVICATVTSDHSFPSTACLIQKQLELKNAFAFDVSAACCGYIYALSLAETLLMQGKVKTALVVATEKMSSITDWKDRSTCVLFGDGAGAAILKKAKGTRGILSSYLKSDGSLGDLLMVPAGGSRMPASKDTIKSRDHYIKMEGNKVFKVAVRRMIESATEAIKIADVKPKNIKLLIPHQANLRIIDAIKQRLDLSKEQVFVNLEKTGNTSAASIAISLSQAQDEELIKKGDIIVLASFGSGFTWAGMVLRW
jgi:3-oxoacyl-[acyl-carrier-protein] synthase III